MARDSDRVPVETPVAGTNKIVMNRIEVADMIRPTTQMAPLFGEGTADDALVIEESVPAVTGEHRAMVPRDSLVGLEVVDLRMSGMVPIDDRVSAPVATNDTTAPLSLSQVEQESMSAIARVNDAVLSGDIEGPLTTSSAAPTAIDTTNESTQKNREAATSLGVAPLEPATTVRAPFVIDTPVQRWSPLPRSQPVALASPPDETAAGSNRLPTTGAHERTAMPPLDPTSGMPRNGPWQAIASLARSLTSVRWWRRRKTSRVKPLAP